MTGGASVRAGKRHHGFTPRGRRNRLEVLTTKVPSKEMIDERIWREVMEGKVEGRQIQDQPNGQR